MSVLAPGVVGPRSSQEHGLKVSVPRGYAGRGMGDSENPTPPGQPEPDPGEIVRRMMGPQLLAAQEALHKMFASDAMQRWNEQIRQQTEAMQRAFASTFAPTIERWSIQLPQISEQVRPVLERFRQMWRDALPPNWANFESEDVRATIERIEQTGFCLVWLPRAAILREVLASPADATSPILLAHKVEVLDDAADLLGDVDEPELALERDAAAAALDALRAGHHMAAQALAASVFTSTAHKSFETGKIRAIREQMAETHPEDAGIAQLRLRAIFLAGNKALSGFRFDRAAPAFNRHDTAHRITAEQWTEGNALSGLMLATAFIRELNGWFRLDREEQAAAEEE